MQSVPDLDKEGP